MSNQRFFLHVYSISFKESFVNPNVTSKDGEKEYVIKDENRSKDGFYFLKEKVQFKMLDKANSTKEKNVYKNHTLSFLTVLKKFAEEHAKDFKNLNEEKMIISEKDKNKPQIIFKCSSTNVDFENKYITGIVKLGSSGYPKDVIGNKSKKIDTDPKFKVSKSDNLVSDLNYLIHLPENAEFGYLVVLGVGNQTPIGVFKKSLSYYLAASPYKIKAQIIPIYCATSSRFTPVVKAINVEVFEKPTKSEQSKRKSTAKVKKKAFKGFLSLPKGHFPWDGYVRATDKEEFVEKQLEHFYTISELSDDMEKNFSLTVEINGIRRNIKVSEFLEFSMGIEVTDNLKYESDGRPQEFSFIKEAKSVIELVQQS